MITIHHLKHRLLNIPYHYHVLAILGLALSIRLLGLNKGIWLDEYLLLERISSEDFLQNLRFQHRPLFYLPYRLWFLMNSSEPFLRLLSVILGMATVGVMIYWMKQYSRLASLLAGLVVATLPIMLRYSHELRGYPLLLLATVSAFYFARRVASEPEQSRGYVGVAVTLSVAVATHLVGIMLIPSVTAYMVFSVHSRYRQIRLNRAVMAIAIPCGIFGYIYLVFLQTVPGDVYWMPSGSSGLLVATASRVLQLHLLFFPELILRNHAPALLAPYDYFIKLLLAVISVGLVLLGDWRRSLPLFAAAVVYWLAVVLYSVVAVPILWYRTALPGLIPFIGFMGLQLATIRITKLRSVAVLSLMILSMVFASVWAYDKAWIPQERWKQLSAALRADWKQGDMVVFYPEYTEGPVRYYFPELPAHAGIAVDRNTSTEEVLERLSNNAARMSGEPGAVSTVYMVVRHDSSVKRDLERYQTLVARLASKCGPAVFSHRFSIMRLSKYELHQ